MGSHYVKKYIKLHVTNYSSCGPEDGLLRAETCRPVNLILDTFDNALCLTVYNTSWYFEHNGMENNKIRSFEK